MKTKRDIKNYKLLYDCVIQGQGQQLEELLSKKTLNLESKIMPNIVGVDKNGDTMLNIAAQNHMSDIIRKCTWLALEILIKRGANLNSQNMVSMLVYL